MREQDKHIVGVATTAFSIAAPVDVWRQNVEQKRNGNKLGWNNFSGLRKFKWTAIGVFSGGIVGNEIYKSKFQKACGESFSSDVRND